MKFGIGFGCVVAVAAVCMPLLSPVSAHEIAGTRIVARDVAPEAAPAFPGNVGDFHGYVSHSFTVDGCNAVVVEPKVPLAGRPWLWRTMFWDAFPAVDSAMLAHGYYVAFIDVGNTYGCPDAMKHFDVFYDQLTSDYGFSKHTALEGLSRGGLYAYRWTYVNAGKVGCLYGDAPVCDMKMWPGGQGKVAKNDGEWQQALNSYHFTDQQMMDFTGNPIDILAPIAAKHVPIIHVCGDSDSYVPKEVNSDIVRERYMKLGGKFVEIVKVGCDHHPHGLADPTPVVDFILENTAGGDVAAEARKTAPKAGTVIVLPKGQW